MTNPSANDTPRSRAGLITLAVVIAAGLAVILVAASFMTDHPGEVRQFGEAVVGKAHDRPDAVRRDLEHMCKVATDATTMRFDSEQERSRWLAEEIFSKLTTLKVIKLFTDIATAPPAEKWPMVLRTAEEAGAPRWSCPALRELLSPPKPAQK
jgi:hypothetical protein